MLPRILSLVSGALTLDVSNTGLLHFGVTRYTFAWRGHSPCRFVSTPQLDRKVLKS
jgi:hypothetical protein